MNMIVKTSCGAVEGFVEDGLNKWFGIPYAAPPVSDLRFKRALPHAPWKGVKPCKKQGNIPHIFVSNSIVPVAGTQGEDCLHLSIWRPNTEEKLPVYVWIYGGAYNGGSMSMPGYDGSNFASKDVVFVSFNYRIGVLGYYDFSPYDREHFDSNCGVSDQIAALKWVKENIAAFGGDESNITLNGESAGGHSVVTMMACPSTKGLFQKAIVQSAYPRNYFFPALSKEITDLFLDRLQLRPQDILKLKTLSVNDMQEAREFLDLSVPQNWPGKFWPAPVIDDLLPALPEVAFAQGVAADVKLILGICRNEGTLFLQMKSQPDSWELVEKMLKTNGYEDKLPAFRSLYGSCGTVEEQLAQLATEPFLIDSIRIANAKSLHSDVWMYRFDYAPEAAKAVGLHAAHAIEIGLALDTVGKDLLATLWTKTPQADVDQLTGYMHGSWVNFAKTGDPNGSLPLTWESYDADKRSTLIFNLEPTLAEKPDEERFRLWENMMLYPDRASL